MVSKLHKIDTKKRFLDLYKAPELGGNISMVCSAVPINRATYYLWIEKDEKFRDAMYEAKMDKCDEAEQELYRRGLEKDTTALIYWLKNNHPNYKEKPMQVNQLFNVGADKGNTITFVNFRDESNS
jgi:hypothetical protein